MSFGSGVLNKIKGKFTDRYHLKIICQLTGECMHEPIVLGFPNADTRRVLSKVVPFLKVVMAVLKVGVVVGKIIRFSCICVPFFLSSNTLAIP